MGELAPGSRIPLLATNGRAWPGRQARLARSVPGCRRPASRAVSFGCTRAATQWVHPWPGASCASAVRAATSPSATRTGFRRSRCPAAHRRRDAVLRPHVSDVLAGLLPLLLVIHPQPARQAPRPDEGVDDIAQDRGDIVLEAVHGKGLAERDGSAAKDCAVIRRAEVGHVGADGVVLRAAQAGVGVEDLFDRQHVVVAVPARGRDDARVRRRPEREVVAVELQAGRAAVGQAAVPDHLAFHALHDPVHGAVVAVGHAPVRAARLEALGDETDAECLLWRAAPALPNYTHPPPWFLPRAALLARGCKVVFTGPCIPGAHPRVAFAHLHHPWRVVTERDVPVVAVAAHVDVTAAGGDVVFGGVEHALGVVFRVGAADDA